MIYIVSGYMRSGTSMMMRCLEAGGLEAAFSPERDKNMNEKYGDEHYKPNPQGFYEFGRKESKQPGYPRMYDGKLIKFLMMGIHNLLVHDHGYRIVFMTRDPMEIVQSYEAFFDGHSFPVRAVCDKYAYLTHEIVRSLRNRKDIHSVTVMPYREVVEFPCEAFERLKEDQWPINIEQAASVVDPEQYRFRKELLTEGL